MNLCSTVSLVRSCHSRREPAWSCTPPIYRRSGSSDEESNRLWISTLNLPVNLNEYLDRNGSPIRYGYVRESWPASYYQTVYATEAGSAEMPSAGRAFTPELITRLVANGVEVVPLILHTGVASLEDDEPPYEEFYRVPPETAAAINAARTAGRRVVAVGTTVVRALETVTDRDGSTHPARAGPTSSSPRSAAYGPSTRC